MTNPVSEEPVAWHSRQDIGDICRIVARNLFETAVHRKPTDAEEIIHAKYLYNVITNGALSPLYAHSTNTIRDKAIDDLEEIAEWFDNRQDVLDGDYGQPEPNDEMRLFSLISQAIKALKGEQP